MKKRWAEARNADAGMVENPMCEQRKQRVLRVLSPVIFKPFGTSAATDFSGR
jgi:hypothetical protein